MKVEKVLEKISTQGVFSLMPEDFAGRQMTIAEVEAIFKVFDAFWMYQGDPSSERPHALLKSGLHSNGFIMCRAVLKYPSLCFLFAIEMFKIMDSKLSKPFGLGDIDVVASSAYSAIPLGWEIARLLSTEKINPQAEYIEVEKDEKGNPTKIRGGIDSKKLVLVVNELMTTGTGSTWESKKAVLDCNSAKDYAPRIIEPVFVLMHRSRDFSLADGSLVQPVFHFDIENFEPEQCPYCQAGSKAIKPKFDNNWQRLHGLA